MHLSHIAQVSVATSELVILLEAYEDFEDVFSVENAEHLLLYKVHDNAINVANGKQISYRPIYSLMKNELFIFSAYIDKNLANKFIRSSKSAAVAAILFTLKSKETLWLYVNYQDLNNPIIKN